MFSLAYNFITVLFNLLANTQLWTTGVYLVVISFLCCFFCLLVVWVYLVCFVGRKHLSRFKHVCIQCSLVPSLPHGLLWDIIWLLLFSYFFPELLFEEWCSMGHWCITYHLIGLALTLVHYLACDLALGLVQYLPCYLVLHWYWCTATFYAIVSSVFFSKQMIMRCTFYYASMFFNLIFVKLKVIGYSK